MTNPNAPQKQIRTITGATFSPLVLNGPGPIAVEFMSYACARCGEMEPVLQEAAKEVRDFETVFRVNIGLDPELADSYAIVGTPTFVMFLNGAEVGRVEGPRPILSGVLRDLSRPFEA